MSQSTYLSLNDAFTWKCVTVIMCFKITKLPDDLSFRCWLGRSSLCILWQCSSCLNRTTMTSVCELSPLYYAMLERSAEFVQTLLMKRSYTHPHTQTVAFSVQVWLVASGTHISKTSHLHAQYEYILVYVWFVCISMSVCTCVVSDENSSNTDWDGSLRHASLALIKNLSKGTKS